MRLLAALVRWRVGWPWYVLVISSDRRSSRRPSPGRTRCSVVRAAGFPAATNGLASLAVFLVVLTLTDGVGEELAWRGFALPRLVQRYSALVASVVLGVLWGLWHLPLLFTEGTALFGQPIWLLLADIVAKSILFTWVFLLTRGSVLIAALLHATTNLFVVSPTVAAAGDLLLPGLALAAKWLLVGVVLLVSGPALTRRPVDEDVTRALTNLVLVMPRPNRVTPSGSWSRSPNGVVYGNRGCLHDEQGRIRRR